MLDPYHVEQTASKCVTSGVELEEPYRHKGDPHKARIPIPYNTFDTHVYVRVPSDNVTRINGYL